MWRHAAGLISVLALAAPGIVAAEETRPDVVEYADDRLSAHLEGMPLAEAMARVGRATGAEIRGQVLEPRDVRVDFDDVPLTDGLHRLLGGQNFTLKYGQGGRLRAIELLGTPGPRVAAAPLPAAPPETTLPLRLGFPRRFPSRRPLKLPAPLVEAMGGEAATFDQVFDVATGEGDGLLRAQASMVALSALERDRRLRRALITAFRRMDDATLAAFAGTSEGQRLEELIEFFAAHSREASLQKKASVVLERLRPPAPEPPG